MGVTFLTTGQEGNTTPTKHPMMEGGGGGSALVIVRHL